MSTISPKPPRAPGKSWTLWVRDRAVDALPPEKLLADKQPSYVSSWIYVFGVLSLASLAVLILSGTILALKGPAWWHFTGVGHFFNSMHLWSVELFFFFMVVHLWGKFWMAAWRGGRSRVWMTGAVTFLVAVPCALTGYVSQQNFDSQWISTQAKDAMNSVGVGSFFNLLNFGQMYSYHVLLLPAAVVALVVAHVLLVRKHGVVLPFELADAAVPADAPATGAPATQTPQNVSAKEAQAHESTIGSYASDEQTRTTPVGPTAADTSEAPDGDSSTQVESS
ncbi:MAG TPA: cytochrome b N-terminal domain-containing protein [Solirubrobacteraceae bacterium]